MAFAHTPFSVDRVAQSACCPGRVLLCRQEVFGLCDKRELKLLVLRFFQVATQDAIELGLDALKDATA